MQSLKYLNPKEGFLFTPEIEKATHLMDPFFKNYPSYLTSGLRTKEDQLRIIIKKAIEFGFHSNLKNHIKGSEFFSSAEVKDVYNGAEVYWWQPVWSEILSVGFIVNPPIKAVCLMDYYSKRTGENMKGKEIDVSLHSKGLAFDIGGGKNLNEVAKCVMHAKRDLEGCMQSYLVERINNAVHINCVGL